MKIASTIRQVNKTKSQNAARANATNKGTNNNANNSAAVAQSPRAKTDTVTLSKKSLTLAAKTATKGQPNVEKAFDRQPDGEDFAHRLGVALVTKETSNESFGNGEGSGNSNAVSSMSSLSNNFSAALDSYKDAQKAEKESKEVAGTLA